MTPTSIEQLAQMVFQQQQELDALRQRIDRYDVNGLRMLWFNNGFGASGGLSGTKNQWARLDHGH